MTTLEKASLDENVYIEELCKQHPRSLDPKGMTLDQILTQTEELARAFTLFFLIHVPMR